MFAIMAQTGANMAEAMLRQEVMELLGGEQAMVRGARRKQAPAGAPGRGKRSAGRVSEQRAPYGHGRSSPASPKSPGVTPLRIAAVDHLAERLDMSPDALLAILNISGRTAQRRRQHGVLSSDESDRLYRIARVVRRAFEVFGAQDSALEWFKKPQPFLEYHAPLELLGSDAGTQTVEQELGRIEYGDFS